MTIKRKHIILEHYLLPLVISCNRFKYVSKACKSKHSFKNHNIRYSATKIRLSKPPSVLACVAVTDIFNNLHRIIYFQQAIAIGLFVALVIKTPNADEDSNIAEDEEEYKLKNDEEWLHNYNGLHIEHSIDY